jgi:hypothetical protein
MTTQAPQQADFITINLAADLLHCSTAAIRQRAARNCFRTKHQGRNVLVSLEDVLKYSSDKVRLPSWEENYKTLVNKKFVSIDQACALTTLGNSYLRTLIRNKTLEGYVTCDGEILIMEESLNVYLNRGNQNDTNSKVS